MNLKRAFYILLFCCYKSSFGAIFDISHPFLESQKSWFLWNGFNNSLFALKELNTGKYPVKAEISGFLTTETFWDTRQIDSLHEGLFLFAPKPVKCDPLGKDINNVGQFNIVVIESKCRAKLFGPQVLGAESFGYLEADFIGNESRDPSVNLIGTDIVASRLHCRLAFLKLTWKDAMVYMITGLYFHPIRIAHIDLDPKVVSHNVGAPLHSNVRVPQFKIGKSWKNNLHLEAIAMAEFDVTDFGPLGPGSDYLRRSMTPMFDVRLWIGPEDTTHLIGVGFDIKRIMPRLVTNNCYRTRETLTSVAFDIYAKLTAAPLSIRTQFIWAQNAANYNMLGGYAVSCIDPCTDKRTYTNLNTLSYWIDFNVDTKISPGLFGGYSKILGSSSPIIPTLVNELTGEPESLVYDRGESIAYIARLVPRIRFNVKPMVFAAELEWTRAGYGTIQTSGKITNVKPVSNVRFILASYYFY